MSDLKIVMDFKIVSLMLGSLFSQATEGSLYNFNQHIMDALTQGNRKDFLRRLQQIRSIKEVEDLALERSLLPEPISLEEISILWSFSLRGEDSVKYFKQVLSHFFVCYSTGKELIARFKKAEQDQYSRHDFSLPKVEILPIYIQQTVSLLDTKLKKDSQFVQFACNMLRHLKTPKKMIQQKISCFYTIIASYYAMKWMAAMDSKLSHLLFQLPDKILVLAAQRFLTKNSQNVLTHVLSLLVMASEKKPILKEKLNFLIANLIDHKNASVFESFTVH